LAFVTKLSIVVNPFLFQITLDATLITISATVKRSVYQVIASMERPLFLLQTERVITTFAIPVLDLFKSSRMDNLATIPILVQRTILALTQELVIREVHLIVMITILAQMICAIQQWVVSMFPSPIAKHATPKSIALSRHVTQPSVMHKTSVNTHLSPLVLRVVIATFVME
jgi:hypothetical protein